MNWRSYFFGAFGLAAAAEAVVLALLVVAALTGAMPWH